MSITNYMSGSILNYNFGGTPYFVPTPLFLGLSTTGISNSGSNSSEPIGSTGYARVSIPNTKAYWSLASSGSLSNVSSLSFPETSGSQGTITHIFLADTSASGTGNILFFQLLTSPKIIQSNTTVSFAASAIQISMTNP